MRNKNCSEVEIFCRIICLRINIGQNAYSYHRLSSIATLKQRHQSTPSNTCNISAWADTA